MGERARRLWAGAEAGVMGYGGVAAVARATGLAIGTVRKGRDEGRTGTKHRAARSANPPAKSTQRGGASDILTAGIPIPKCS